MRASSISVTIRAWLMCPNASMSDRVMPQSFAIFCATSNCIFSWLSHAARNAGENGPVPPRAFDAMGARVIDSTPQAITRS